MQEKNKIDVIEAVSYALALIALWAILEVRLLAALLSGLLVYSLVHLAGTAAGAKNQQRTRAPAGRCRAGDRNGRKVARPVMTWGVHRLFPAADAGNLQGLLQKLADMLDSSRNQLPPWISEYFPSDVASLKEMITNWLREHAMDARVMGEEAGRAAAHFLLWHDHRRSGCAGT